MPRTHIGNHWSFMLTGRIAVLAVFFCICVESGLAQAPTPFVFTGWNYNTRQAASALNALQDTWGETNPATFTSLAANSRLSVDRMRGPELVADSLSMALWRPWDITHQRVRTIREERGWHTWSEGYVRLGHVGADKRTGAMRYDTSRYGYMFGADYGDSRYWQFGGVFGHGLPCIDNDLGRIHGDDFTVGLYSKYNFFDQGAISTFLGYGYQHCKMRRNGFSGALHYGSFSGDAGYASIEYTHIIPLADLGALMPLIAVDYQTAWTKRFSETPHSNQWSQSVSGSNMGRTMLRFGIDSKWDALLFGDFDLASRVQGAFLLEGDRRASVTSTTPMTDTAMNLRSADLGWFEFNTGLTASGIYGERYNWFIDFDVFTTGCIVALQGQFGLSTRW